MSLQPLSRPALLAVGDGGDFYGFGWSGAPQRAAGSLGCRRAELNPWEGLSGVLPPCPVEPWVLPIPVPAAFGPALVPSLSEPSASAFPQCHLAATSPRLGRWALDTHPVASAASREAAVPRGTEEHPPGIPCPGAGVRCPERRGYRRCRCPATSQSYKEMPEPRRRSITHRGGARRGGAWPPA